MKIVVIGAGGWGTAMASVLSENSHDVSLWTHELDLIDEINKYHTNTPYLKGAKIHESIVAVNDNKSIADADVIINAVPTQYIRSLYEDYKLPIEGKILINGSKGIEEKKLLPISQIFADLNYINNIKYCILTGPSHAEEVIKKSPTTVVAASNDIELARLTQDLFNTDYFRVYTSKDVTGCEMGGALKNVIAIAAGIIDGLQYGDNTKAALVTRGLAEISRIGVIQGADHKTFSGLSGLGDLFVTCASQHSRNRFVGFQIGSGKKYKQIAEEMKMVAEGVFTSKSAYSLGQQKNVELPIIEEVYKIIFENKDPEIAIYNLMTRKTRSEWW